MRVLNINLVAVLVAAIAMYAVGALIYGVLFSQAWMALSGYTQDSFAGNEWRMALGPVMPLITAFGLALVFQRLDVNDRPSGLAIAACAWLFFTFTSRLYSFSYGIEPVGLLGLDSLHLLLTHLVGGAILAKWR